MNLLERIDALPDDAEVVYDQAGPQQEYDYVSLCNGADLKRLKDRHADLLAAAEKAVEGCASEYCEDCDSLRFAIDAAKLER